MQRADLWESSADERERLADEREFLADERDMLADERDRLADRQEQAQDRRDADRTSSGEPGDEDDEASMVLAAVRRAEAAVRRAQGELERTQQAAVRLGAKAARRTAAKERRATACNAAASFDAEDLAWMADRRDFVAAERDHLADERNHTADRREQAASRRERIADDRERDLLDRQRRFEQTRSTRRRAVARGAATPVSASQQSDGERDRDRQRQRTAADRRSAANDRARAAATWGPHQYGPMLLASFAPLARQLCASDQLHEVITQVLKFTVGAVEGCTHASVTLYRNGRSVDAIATDQVAAELDDLQFSTGIGPGPQALLGRNTVSTADLRDGKRWPVLAAMARQLDVGGVLCLGLFADQPMPWSALGVLSLYGSAAETFGPDQQDFAAVLAAYVAVAVATDRRREEVDRREAALHRGLSTRDVIGQAKGILMERQHLSAGDAFDLLRSVSQRLNRKLADVAEQLAETGELPK